MSVHPVGVMLLKLAPRLSQPCKLSRRYSCSPVVYADLDCTPRLTPGPAFPATYNKNLIRVNVRNTRADTPELCRQFARYPNSTSLRFLRALCDVEFLLRNCFQMLHRSPDIFSPPDFAEGAVCVPDFSGKIDGKRPQMPQSVPENVRT